jgi:hypothetical protein
MALVVGVAAEMKLARRPRFPIFASLVSPVAFAKVVSRGIRYFLTTQVAGADRIRADAGGRTPPAGSRRVRAPHERGVGG